MLKSKNTKPVILQIIPALQNGGVERGVIDVAKFLKKSDFEPIVVSSGGLLVRQLQEKSIKHITLEVHSKNPFIIYANIKKLVGIIKKYQVDIVHVRSRAPMISAFYACRQANCKLVSTVHGTYSLNLLSKNSLLKKLYNSIMLKADSVIAVSNFVKNHLIKNYQLPIFDKKEKFSTSIARKFINQKIFDKIKVVQRGADLEYFCAENISKNRVIDLIGKWHLPEDKNIILFPARFTAWKGHEFLIEALAKVKNQDFFCVMIGSTIGHQEFKQKIEQKILDMNLEGKVRSFNTCSDMPAAYSLSDLVISASIRPEAFGRIAIEAQAMKRLIIATKIGGSLETVIPNETGFLVEPNNIEDLAKSIDFALSLSAEEKVKITNSARAHIEKHFSCQNMCKQTAEIYRELLS
jgi:glycosyltransferase involved in cell wall biosynthesis